MKNKIFIACDTVKIKKIREILKNSKNNKLNLGYKFGLEFINSKGGRRFISKLKKEKNFSRSQVA